MLMNIIMYYSVLYVIFVVYVTNAQNIDRLIIITYSKHCRRRKAEKKTNSHPLSLHSVFLWIPPVSFRYPEIKKLLKYSFLSYIQRPVYAQPVL